MVHKICEIIYDEVMVVDSEFWKGREDEDVFSEGARKKILKKNILEKIKNMKNLRLVRMKISMKELKKSLKIIFIKEAFIKYKYVVLASSFFGIFWLFQNNGVSECKDMMDNIKSVITIIGVSIALIISFLISKLYFDKTIGIERKKIKDTYSKKLTGIRLLLKHVYDNSTFWVTLSDSKNIKNIIEEKHSTLTYKSFCKLDYWGKENLCKSIGINCTLIECYLAIKYIVDYEKPLSVDNLEVVYNLKDLKVLNEMFYKAGLLFDRGQSSSLPDFKDVHDAFSYKILEILNICGISAKNKALSNDDLLDVFSNIHEAYIDKIIKFSKKRISLNAIFLRINFFIYVIIMLLSIVFLSVNNATFDKIYWGNIIITTLIINTIDLTINIFKLFKEESEIKEFLSYE